MFEGMFTDIEYEEGTFEPIVPCDDESEDGE